MKKLWEYLSGKKTFIIAILGGIAFVLARLGVITTDVEVQVYALLGIGGIATIRHAIK